MPRGGAEDVRDHVLATDPVRVRCRLRRHEPQDGPHGTPVHLLVPKDRQREVLVVGMTAVSALEETPRIACRELVRWMVADYGFDQWDADMMPSQCGKVRRGNFVDPEYTIGAAVPKKYIQS